MCLCTSILAVVLLPGPKLGLGSKMFQMQVQASQSDHSVELVIRAGIPSPEGTALPSLYFSRAEIWTDEIKSHSFATHK